MLRSDFLIIDFFLNFSKKIGTFNINYIELNLVLFHYFFFKIKKKIEISLKRNQKIVWKHPLHKGNTIVYEGNTKNGVPHGKGQLTTKMGNNALRQLFQGTFKEGSTYGKGKRDFSIDTIFFIGGDFPTDEKNPFSSFSFFTDNWEVNSSYASCRYPRSIGKLMFHEHYFYYIGGFDGNRAVPHVERFDIFNGTWENLCPLTNRRTSFCSFLYDSNIYVCGGLMGSVIHRDIEKYDFKKKQMGNLWFSCDGKKWFYGSCLG